MTLDEAYSLLGLTKNATKDQVREAYRRLAKINHPDRGGDVKIFVRIAQAYGIVCNPRKAVAKYDPDIVTPFFRKKKT